MFEIALEEADVISLKKFYINVLTLIDPENLY